MMKNSVKYILHSALCLSIACLLPLFTACQGALNDEDMELLLLKGSESDMGLSLLRNDEDGNGSNAASSLVGTWLEVAGEEGDDWYVGGFIFKADGTGKGIDDVYDDADGVKLDGDDPIKIGEIGKNGPTNDQLRKIVNYWTSYEPSFTWRVSGNIIYLHDLDDADDDEDHMKFIIKGNTLLLFEEYDEKNSHDDELDEDGDGWIDEPEWILTRYNF